jgi:photosystem II PsbZ protein
VKDGSGEGQAPDLQLKIAQGAQALLPIQILNTLNVLVLEGLSLALNVAVPVLYASNEDSGRSNRLILIGGAAWVALVLVNWGMSLLVV